jgi:hypothetical protein
MTGTTGLCGFAVSVDRALAQITLRGRPTGAAGGATIRPRPGVELAFDRTDGWLSRVVVAASQSGDTTAVDEETVTWIASVFGASAAETVRKAPHAEVQWLPPQERPEALRALSRLARLDAARITSPVPASPLWVAEAEDLARRIGLSLPSRALSTPPAPMTSPESPGAAIPANVMRLLAEGEGEPSHGASDNGAGRLTGLLDLGLVPHEVFRPGLWPGSDLDVQVHQHGASLITVETALLPGASPRRLADCRVRLVDAGTRRVLAITALRAWTPTRARAELPAPAWLRALVRSGQAWVEVVGDERRPVHGARLRRVRRALRWGDAALRAESRPNGLAPELSDEQWTRLAALAWDRCRADWEAAGDLGRAGIAASRGAALRGTRRALPFLAELVMAAPPKGDQKLSRPITTASTRPMSTRPRCRR